MIYKIQPQKKPTDNMKKLIYIFALLFSLQLSAQIGINTDTPQSTSVVDINSPSNADKGLLIPRMTTVQKTAILNPAHSLLVYDTDKKCISQNLGTEAVPQWTCLALFNRKFFYMPSINIETATLGSGSKNLYAQYKEEYGTPKYKSTGAPAAIPYFPAATDLYYYVTYHNPSRITINSIDGNGIMSYVTTTKANYDDYINIVFVVK